MRATAILNSLKKRPFDETEKYLGKNGFAGKVSVDEIQVGQGRD